MFAYKTSDGCSGVTVSNAVYALRAFSLFRAVSFASNHGFNNNSRFLEIQNKKIRIIEIIEMLALL